MQVQIRAEYDGSQEEREAQRARIEAEADRRERREAERRQELAKLGPRR